MFVLLVDTAQQLRGRKTIILLSAKIPLSYLWAVPIEASLYKFLVLIVSCLLVSNPTATFGR